MYITVCSYIVLKGKPKTISVLFFSLLTFSLEETSIFSNYPNLSMTSFNKLMGMCTFFKAEADETFIWKAFLYYIANGVFYSYSIELKFPPKSKLPHS